MPKQTLNFCNWSLLQQNELQQKRHPFELVFVQNNPLFDFETRSYQQPAIHQINNVEVDSHQVLISEADLNTSVEIQFALPKPIIKPWEELVNNKHITSFGYDKDASLHIPDYSNPIQFHNG